MVFDQLMQDKHNKIADKICYFHFPVVLNFE